MEKSDSKNRIKVTEVTEKNLKEGQKVRIAPSVDIIRFVVDTIAENGLAGVVIKGKDEKLYITAAVNIVADAIETVKHETVIEEFEMTDDDEKKETAANAD